MTWKEITDEFNKLSINDRKAYLDYLKSQSQRDYDKFVKSIRQQAVQDFWNYERELILNGKSTSNWTPKQIERIMNIDPETGAMNPNARAAFALNADGTSKFNSKQLTLGEVRCIMLM